MKIITINAMWCPGCIVMHKVWDEVRKDYPDIEIINYDYDMDEDIVNTFNPGSILPITIFIVNDKEVYRLNGEKNKKELVDIIEKYK